MNAATVESFSANGCSGLKAGILPVSTFAAMRNSSCASGLDFSTVDASRIAVLSNDTCDAMVPTSFMPGALEAMTTACINNWAECGEIESFVFPRMTRAQFQAIDYLCWAHIARSDSAWVNISAAQLQLVPVCSKMDGHVWAVIPAKSYAGLTPRCVSRLSTFFSSDNPCRKFPAAAAAYIPATAFPVMDGGCFGAFSPAFIAALPPSSIASLTVNVTTSSLFYSTLIYMTDAGRQALPNAVLKDIRSKNYEGMDEYVESKWFSSIRVSIFLICVYCDTQTSDLESIQ
jgi:hypothetical protein